MPLRMIEWVWPPHTSMIAQSRVVLWWISSKRRRASPGSLNSSRYFIELLLELRGSGSRRRCRR